MTKRTYKLSAPERAANRDRVRKHRARKRAAAAGIEPLELVPAADPVAALEAWAADTLKVPPGHPLAGESMALPAFAADFLRAGWDAQESALSVARKNAKSAICAVLVLGFLVGPLRRPGWRAALASISKEKAGELRAQIAEIIEASGLLDEVRIRRSPYPGAIESSTGTVETLSADKSAGHAGGYDLVIIDETGLTEERDRDYVAGLRSSISARGGRLIHISIRGASPIFGEILDNPAIVRRVYAAPDDCDLADRDAWAAANPGLGTIKQIAYMENEVERIKSAPADEPSFRAFDLNLPGDPAREMILTPGDLKACFVETEDLPARAGPVALGFDFGESLSGTAAVAIWPQTGRLETWLAFGDKPTLKVRGQRDNADYVTMEKRGEVRTYAGRVVSVAEFLSDVADDLKGQRIGSAAADGFKDSESRDFLELADLRWPVQFRRVGAGKDGGRDVRAFQRLIHQRKLSMLPNLSLSTAISKSTIRRDENGNPGLRKASKDGRIDVLSAAVIAAGLAEPIINRPRRPGARAWVI